MEADGYYQSSQMSGYHDLIWFDYDDKEQMFDGHSYNKGGRILHMLRNYLGDEAFFEGMRNYLTTNKFKPAEFHQLRLAFEEVSGEDLNWFFDQWFLGSGHPVLEFKQEVEPGTSNVSLTVKQNQNLDLSPIFKLPMSVAIYDSNGKHTHKITVDSLEQRFVFPFSGTLKCVIFDEQQMLLAKVREEKPLDQSIFQYYNNNRYRSRFSALMNGTKGKSANVQQLILDALSDPFWNIRLTAIEKCVKLEAENKTKGLAIIKGMALNDANSQVRTSAINFLANNAATTEGEAVFIERIEKDQSYMVVSAALRSLGKTNPNKALELAKKLEAEKSSKMVAGVAQLYGAHGGADVYPFFKNALSSNKTLQGFDQLSVMNSMTYFIVRQDISLIEESFTIYERLEKEGGYYTQMFVPQNVGYIVSFFDEKIEEKQAEIEVHEKNKDAAYADKARKELKQYSSLKEKFNTLLTEE